jgi:hypothetical protein
MVRSLHILSLALSVSLSLSLSLSLFRSLLKYQSNMATEHGSADFDEFCEFLGTKITLKDWNKYRGGLDVKSMCC